MRRARARVNYAGWAAPTNGFYAQRKIRLLERLRDERAGLRENYQTSTNYNHFPQK